MEILNKNYFVIMQFVLFSATPVRLILATGIQNANFDIGRMDLYDNLGC